MCLLINMAAFKGVDGKLWCELLSSDKYKDSANHKGNTRSLQLFIQNSLQFHATNLKNSIVLPINFFFI